jgi:mono/diheme cytochrome c family protein
MVPGGSSSITRTAGCAPSWKRQSVTGDPHTVHNEGEPIVKQRKSILVLGGLGVLFLAIGLTAVRVLGASHARQVDRGRYLVSSLGCADCHSPKKMGPQGPEPDEDRFLAGHPEDAQLPPPPARQAGPWVVVASWDLTAWSGPWGVSYPFNLTPDENTGLGSWSEETFVKALRTGRHMGVSRPILPPMPWESFRNLSDDDLKAIFAYLRSLPAVKNRVPDPVIAPAPVEQTSDARQP